MILRVDDVLGTFAAELADLAPTIQPVFRSAQIASISMLLRCAADDWDDAAQRLVEENQALRRLFGEIAPLIDDKDLRAALDAHIAAKDENFRISALQAVNEAMRTTLIRAHAVIELLDGEAARSANDAIWRELRQSTERRHRSTDMYY